MKTQGNGGVERCEVEVGTFGIHPVFEEQIKRDFFHCPGMKYIDSPQSIDWKYRTVFPTEDE